jgi:ABC-2 type transport system permease protein
MKKYLFIIKTTFIDSLQYVSSILFKFVGFSIMMYVLASLWRFIYSDGTNIINGYTFNKMIWYLLLAELVTFSCGSAVASDEVKNNIKSGNIAYQVNKPYNYIGYVVSKYIAASFIRFIFFFIIVVALGLIFAGRIEGFNYLSILAGIPIYFLAILILGLIKILISLIAFWVEDSKPFQLVYNKIVLIFGIMFPLEMFPKVVGTIIRYSPIYGTSYGPAKLILDFSLSLFGNVLLSQIITVIIILLIIKIVYGRGVKKLNVNGG